ncbi:MarR family transcriptional regulator [Brevundimonas sp.]|jgi:DNA-binding MarR family transcriptional regulator|uniref:MarR family transcriptional regulator n=1 Tax=Brevundimonas sp. TaxID=1871086 RepID=UPI003784DED0
MTVADTSIYAYRSLTVGDLSKGQAAVMRVIGERTDHTRAEIAARAGIPLQSVCGRVNELIAAGLLEHGPRRLCSRTKNPANPVRLPRAQLELI